MTVNPGKLHERCESSNSSSVAVYPVNDIAVFLARDSKKSIGTVKKMIRRIGIVRAFNMAVKKGFLP